MRWLFDGISFADLHLAALRADTVPHRGDRRKIVIILVVDDGCKLVWKGGIADIYITMEAPWERQQIRWDSCTQERKAEENEHQRQKAG